MATRRVAAAIIGDVFLETSARRTPTVWVTFVSQVCLNCRCWRVLEELQWLFRWQPHFPNSKGQRDKAGLPGSMAEPTSAHAQTYHRTCQNFLLFLYVFTAHPQQYGPCFRKGCERCKYSIHSGGTVVIRMPHVCEDTQAEPESRQEDIGEGGRKGKCSLEWRLKLSAFIYRSL